MELANGHVRVSNPAQRGGQGGEDQHVRSTLKRLHAEVLQEVDKRMGDLVEEAVSQLARSQKEPENHKKSTSAPAALPGELREKHFTPRNSLLTDISTTPHISALVNIATAVGIVALVNTAIDVYLLDSYDVSLSFLGWCFRDISEVMSVWFTMKTATCAIYFFFKLWANQRAAFQPNSTARRLWDSVALVLLILYQMAFLYYPARYVHTHDMTPVCSIATLLEQLRMLMKSHAFFRSNIPRALSFEVKDDAKCCPTFSQYIYFLFAPTIIYRDHYPRTRTAIRWGLVMWRFTEAAVTIVCCGFIVDRCLLPSFRQFGPQTTVADVAKLAFRFSFSATTTFYLGCFYGMQHSWMNAFAEMLHFSDRLFYEDFWNSSSYRQYYRKWNLLVHNYIYTYFYKDIVTWVRNASGRRKYGFLPTLSVILVSAVVHEYVLALALGFFYPVMFVTFAGFGMCLLLLPTRNTTTDRLFFLITILFGNGMMASLYCIEWYSRTNCAQTRDDFADFFIPRSWNCIAK